MILIGFDDLLKQWAEKRLGMEVSEPCKAIGVYLDNQIAAVCLYRNYREYDIEMVFASDNPRWANRGNLRTFFSYPFEQLGCVRVSAYCSQHNKRSRKLIEGLGFKLEGMIRRGYDGKINLCAYGILKDECRWINMIKKAA